MAKLPDERELGTVPRLQGDGRIASYDLQPVVRGGELMAKSGENLGAGIQKVGVAVADYDLDNSRYQYAKAHSQFLVGRHQLEDAAQDDQQYQDLGARHAEKLDKVRDQAAATISNPLMRDRFVTDVAPLSAESGVKINRLARNKYKDATLADADTQLENLRQTALKDPDPTRAVGYIRTGQGIITSLRDQGIVSAENAVRTQRLWVTNYAKGKIDLMADDEKVDTLQHPVANDADYLNRVDRAEGRSQSTTSSATGKFQFTDKTWLDTVKKNRPDLAENRSDADILRLRQSDSVADEMMGHLTNANAGTLKRAGVDTGYGSLYLAHFLGAKGAIAVLKADPYTPVADLVDKAAIDANRSVLQGKTANDVVAWANRKMGGQTDTVANFLPDDVRHDLLQRAQTAMLTKRRNDDAALGLDQFRLKGQVNDDVASMLHTGKGVDGITRDQVHSLFGAKAVDEWQNARDDAHSIWTNTHDLAALTDQQIAGRLASIKPAEGSESFARQQKVFEEVQKQAAATLTLRHNDPAASVKDDPGVKAALSNYDPHKPETFQSVALARMSAQARAGLGDGQSTPITKAEALQLTEGLKNALPGTERDVIKKMDMKFQQMFGEHTSTALAYALHFDHIDKEHREASARVLRKIAAGQVPTTDEARDADTAEDIAASRKAAGGAGDPFNNTGSTQRFDMFGSGPASSPPPMLVPPNKAIMALRDKPELAAQFDEKYGEGAAERILKAYPKGKGR